MFSFRNMNECISVLADCSWLHPRCPGIWDSTSSFFLPAPRYLSWWPSWAESKMAPHWCSLTHGSHLIMGNTHVFFAPYILGEQLFPKFQLSIQHQRPLQPISRSLDSSDTAHTTCLLSTRNSKGPILSSLSGLLEVFFLRHGVKSTAPSVPLGWRRPLHISSNLQLMALLYPWGE